MHRQAKSRAPIRGLSRASAVAISVTLLLLSMHAAVQAASTRHHPEEFVVPPPPPPCGLLVAAPVPHSLPYSCAYTNYAPAVASARLSPARLMPLLLSAAPPAAPPGSIMPLSTVQTDCHQLSPLVLSLSVDRVRSFGAPRGITPQSAGPGSAQATPCTAAHNFPILPSFALATPCPVALTTVQQRQPAAMPSTGLAWTAQAVKRFQHRKHVFAKR